MELERTSWMWLPNIGLGKLKLGVEVDQYLKSLDIEKMDYHEINRKYGVEHLFADTERYQIKNDSVSLSAVGGLIDSISTERELIYNNQNIIGKSIANSLKILGIEPSKVDAPVENEDGQLTVYYDFDGSGLLLWTCDGIVTGASIFDDTEC